MHHHAHLPRPPTTPTFNKRVVQLRVGRRVLQCGHKTRPAVLLTVSMAADRVAVVVVHPRVLALRRANLTAQSSTLAVRTHALVRCQVLICQQFTWFRGGDVLLVASPFVTLVPERGGAGFSFIFKGQLLLVVSFSMLPFILLGF